MARLKPASAEELARRGIKVEVEAKVEPVVEPEPTPKKTGGRKKPADKES